MIKGTAKTAAKVYLFKIAPSEKAAQKNSIRNIVAKPVLHPSSPKKLTFLSREKTRFIRLMQTNALTILAVSDFFSLSPKMSGRYAKIIRAAVTALIIIYMTPFSSPSI